MHVEDVMTNCELTPLDCKTLIKFTCSKNNHLIASVLDLKKTSRVRIQYYNSVKNIQASNKFGGEKGDFTSSDKFLSVFISI